MAGYPESLAPGLLGTIISLTALSTVFMGLRIFCRVKLSKFGWDDAWMAVTLIFSWVMAVCSTMYAHAGGAQYVPLSTDMAIFNIVRLDIHLQVQRLVAMTTGKLAIGALILRLQAPCQWRTYLIWVMCIILTVWDAFHIIWKFVQCRPVAKLWHPDLNGKCFDPRFMRIFELTTDSYLASLDLAFVAISLQMIWHIQMPRKRKIGVCCLLSTGILSFAVTIVRMIFNTRTPDTYPDLIHFMVDALILDSAGVNVVIVAGCLPTVRPLFQASRSRRPSRTGQRNSSTCTPRAQGHGAGSRTFSDNNEWARCGSFQTVVSADPRALEMKDGIRVTREIEIKSSSTAEGSRDARK